MGPPRASIAPLATYLRSHIIGRQAVALNGHQQPPLAKAAAPGYAAGAQSVRRSHGATQPQQMNINYRAPGQCEERIAMRRC